ncbi:MAG: TRAP transporter small permease [Pseudomonadota bacterium]
MTTPSTRTSGTLAEWLLPLGFIACGAWVVWNGPSYINSFGLGAEALAVRYPAASTVDLLILALLPILFIAGLFAVRPATLETDDRAGFDRVSLFLGRVTMFLIAILVGVMFFEVVMRYVFERPTLWANELSLWLAGFVFLFAGLYAMQQRSHIRIFLLYDLMPRWLQKICDTASVLMIVGFAVAMVWGAYGEARDKFFRWETFGTAFDPPIPATMKPILIVCICMVAIQAVSNLILDWSKAKVLHSPVDDLDEIAD